MDVVELHGEEPVVFGVADFEFAVGGNTGRAALVCGSCSCAWLEIWTWKYEMSLLFWLD